jgi:catechol 2,3-dioxygenase-like lactoylglutathione lyase family enzyme
MDRTANFHEAENMRRSTFNLQALRALCALLFAACLPLAAQNAQPLNGVAHVAFRVSDVPKSREFYKSLGWEQAFEFGDDRGTATSYVKVNDRQFIELYRTASPSDALGLMHICIDAADVEAAAAACLAAGLKASKPNKARAGNLLFNVQDPERRLVEYCQYLPASLHMTGAGKFLVEGSASKHMVRVSQQATDMAAETAFYTAKLGFADRGNGRLDVPGRFGESIVLEPAAPDWKPRLVFEARDLKQTAADMQKRGLPFKVTSESVTVRDPDGAYLVFAVTR